MPAKSLVVCQLLQTEDWGDFIKRAPFQAFELQGLDSDDSSGESDDDSEEYSSDEEDDDEEEEEEGHHRTSTKSQ